MCKQASVYALYHYLSVLYLQLRSSDSNRDSFCTDSSTGILSPVPGSGLWESEITEIELPKGDKGLGFSILDFAVSLIPQNVTWLSFDLQKM